MEIAASFLAHRCTNVMCKYTVKLILSWDLTFQRLKFQNFWYQLIISYWICIVNRLNKKKIMLLKLLRNFTKKNFKFVKPQVSTTLYEHKYSPIYNW